jgi:integrase
MLWNAGVPVPEISKRIGHASPKVTMERYAHIFDNKQSASLAALNSLVKEKKK